MFSMKPVGWKVRKPQPMGSGAEEEGRERSERAWAREVLSVESWGEMAEKSKPQARKPGDV
jgi:hypothetical protein